MSLATFHGMYTVPSSFLTFSGKSMVERTRVGTKVFCLTLLDWEASAQEVEKNTYMCAVGR